MDRSPNSAVADYRSVHFENDIANASGHRLIQMLMQRLLADLMQAEQRMVAGEVARKGELISEAISIIDCLRTSLTFDNGGDVAANLDALYDYMIRTLLLANMNGDSEQLRSVTSLVEEIKGAWDAIGDKV